jgi:hypothetical protein
VGERVEADEDTKDIKERNKGGEGWKYERNSIPQETKLMLSLKIVAYPEILS